MTARDDVLSGLEMLFHREGMPNWRDLAAGRIDAYRAEVLREAADRLDAIAGQAEAKVAGHYGTASGIGPGSCDMVREAARDLRRMAAAVPGPRGDAEPWRPIRFCGRPATHPAHLYLHAREAVRCMGSAHLGPAQPPADTTQEKP